MLDRIDLPDLTAFSQPAWNDPQSLAVAFKSVLAAADEVSCEAAYHQLLYSLGNDHAETYYPIALAIPPLFEGILRDGGVWSQNAALQVLIEICASFKPETGHQVCEQIPLDSLIRKATIRRMPLVKALANGQSIAAKSARELLELIGLPPGAR